ncbi:MAG: Bax inhibitor-1/YccA family protein [Paraprevotella sp.]|nr:Bax inhibitor-1/YccA family protein [Paraprevotella sp.]
MADNYSRSYKNVNETTAVSPVATLMQKVYLWMALALCASGLTALGAASSETIMNLILGSRTAFFLLIIAEVGVVFYLNIAIRKIPFKTAAALFMVYSILNGATLSVIFLVFQLPSIVSTFFITAGTFGAMAWLGHTTKKDLSSIGQMLSMALIGLIIASIVNIFWANNILYWIITYVGVFTFVGLTAYDAQKIKNMLNKRNQHNSEEIRKIALMGSLMLYLDFVNLFLYLLRMFGKKK